MRHGGPCHRGNPYDIDAHKEFCSSAMVGPRRGSTMSTGATTTCHWCRLGRCRWFELFWERFLWFFCENLCFIKLNVGLLSLCFGIKVHGQWLTGCADGEANPRRSRNQDLSHGVGPRGKEGPGQQPQWRMGGHRSGQMDQEQAAWGGFVVERLDRSI